MARNFSDLIKRKRSGKQKATAPAEGSQNGREQPPQKDEEQKLGGEMTFLEHLEDLRWTFIKGGAGILILVVIAAIFSDWIVDEVLMGPARADFFIYRLLDFEATTLVLQSRNPTGQFFAHMGVILAAGVLAGLPILIYFLWKFIEPGLYPKERKSMRYAALAASVFFLLGAAFGYCVTTPLALQFFNNYQISDIIVNEFDIPRYFSMLIWWVFGAGVLFDLPVVIYFLARLGIATPERLKASRKYAVPGLMLISAFMTPQDPFTMILMWLPLMLLFEGSIYVSKVSLKRRDEELEKALA